MHMHTHGRLARWQPEVGSRSRSVASGHGGSKRRDVDIDGRVALSTYPLAKLGLGCTV